MPKDEREKEVPRLMTIPEIAADRGLSRQRVHRIARSDPKFPSPVLESGSTRAKYPSDKVDEYFRTRVLQPGRRTDLEDKQQGEGGSK